MVTFNWEYDAACVSLIKKVEKRTFEKDFFICEEARDKVEANAPLRRPVFRCLPRRQIMTTHCVIMKAFSQKDGQYQGEKKEEHQ